MVSVTYMTKLVLPGMLKRGKGVVINIGSGISKIPSPLLAVYAASKVCKIQSYFIIIINLFDFYVFYVSSLMAKLHFYSSILKGPTKFNLCIRQ